MAIVVKNLTASKNLNLRHYLIESCSIGSLKLQKYVDDGVNLINSVSPQTQPFKFFTFDALFQKLFNNKK